MSKIDGAGEAARILGHAGAMVSGSKTAPKGETVVWNANILTRVHGKIWFGDVSLTRSATKLQELANVLGAAVHVLRESDARFMTEANPRWENAVAVIEPASVSA